MLARMNYIKVDELGMDPLRDASFEAIASVEIYQLYTVDSSTKFNSPLISELFYQTVELWYVILYYNKLADNFQLKEGLRIKIPNVNELTSALSKLNSTIRTTRI